jgi:hypothetical protein
MTIQSILMVVAILLSVVVVSALVIWVDLLFLVFL